MRENQIIGELVAKDYRTASVFKNIVLTFVVKAIERFKRPVIRKTLIQKMY
jgi:hypothetical protein